VAPQVRELLEFLENQVTLYFQAALPLPEDLLFLTDQADPLRL